MFTYMKDTGSHRYRSEMKLSANLQLVGVSFATLASSSTGMSKFDLWVLRATAPLSSVLVIIYYERR